MPLHPEGELEPETWGQRRGRDHCGSKSSNDELAHTS